jgi:phosphopantothenate-cysteine ligase
LEAFVVRHAAHHRPVALVTSGGTVVDLEKNSVRCLDNFSTGLRGAISCEEFLKRGYAVIHLWREGSASPYARVLSQCLNMKQANFGLTFDSLGYLFTGNDTDPEEEMMKTVLEESNDPWLTESDPFSSTGNGGAQHRQVDDGSILLHRRLAHSSRLQKALRERKTVMEEGRLLTISFRSVEQYLAKLQLCAESLRHCNSLALVYLAAAVSDFYIPSAEKSEHKIQSSSMQDGLVLKLSPVPKVIGLLREKWAPDAFVVSFKLETDENILRQKADAAVEKYRVNMVIGNILDTRHKQVWVLYPSVESKKAYDWKAISRPRNNDTDALEEALLDFVVERHFDFVSRNWNDGTEAAIRNHELLQEKKRKVKRDMFWKRVKNEILALAGPVVGGVLTYSIMSVLRSRIAKSSQ